MALQVNQNADVASATNPDGTVNFPINVSGSSGVAQGSTTAGELGPLDQTATTTAAPTYTTGTTNPFSSTVRGGTRVEGVHGTNTSTSNPFPGGVTALTANLAAATTGRTVANIGTLVGVPIVLPYCIPEQSWLFAGATGGIVNTTTAVTIQAAQAAGIRNYCTRIQLATDAITTASEFAIRDGAAGTVIWRTKLNAAVLQTINISFDPPLRGTAATLMEVVTLTATGAALGVFVNAQGFAAP